MSGQFNHYALVKRIILRWLFAPWKWLGVHVTLHLCHVYTPLSEAYGRERVFHFVQHYMKCRGFAQSVLYSPRIPYVSYVLGFSMPTRQADVGTNSMFHLILLKPTKCHGNCDEIMYVNTLCHTSVAEQLLPARCPGCAVASHSPVSQLCFLSSNHCTS